MHSGQQLAIVFDSDSNHGLGVGSAEAFVLEAANLGSLLTSKLASVFARSVAVAIAAPVAATTTTNFSCCFY